jgi:hypothetical protein
VKNTTVLTASKILQEFKDSSSSIALHVAIEMNKDDYLQFYAGKTTNSGRDVVNPLFPALRSGPGSLNGLNPKSKFLAINYTTRQVEKPVVIHDVDSEINHYKVTDKITKKIAV